MDNRGGKLENGNYGIRFLASLEGAVEKINKRARKNGLQEIKVEVVKVYYIEDLKDDGVGGYIKTGKMIKMHEVKIEAPVVKVDGWFFIAKIQHLESGNVISKGPGYRDEELAFLWNSKPNCDHCGTKRIRKETFLLRKDNENKIVGRQCLRDFIGYDIEEQMWLFNAVADFMGDAEEDGFEGSGGWEERYFNIKEYLGAVAACIRVYGYRKSDSVYPTAFDALNIVGLNWKYKPEEGHAEPEVEPRDYEAADAAIKWLQEQPEKSDYIHNLKVVVASEVIGERGKNCCLLASLMPVHYKAVTEAKEKESGPAKQGGYVGEVGKRMEIKAKVQKIVHYESATWGEGALLIFQDADGNDYKWFTSGDRWLNEGEEVVLKGTVKEHAEYQGRKQTVLSRCKILDSKNVREKNEIEKRCKEAEAKKEAQNENQSN